MDNLLARARHLSEAYELARDMPSEIVNESVIGTLFGGCKIHPNMDLAEKFREKVVYEIWKLCSIVEYIYGAAEKWEGVEDVRKVMSEIGVHKRPGCSWI
ncbi:hypothetical protein AMTR_s00022p00189600 [Amborella trichopoda]|uniref:Uncharacterized protein n=1 Tax=Amborella trichopoda TaxID=13333 RepID=W1PU68_AMBTC|nr:hypothetical protein AMTR_s00022p00189600 [Amborella trichopoda]